MIGLDATTLIAFEIKEHPIHSQVRKGIREELAMGERFALCDQTGWEFLHIVTDARRFDTPLDMEEALVRLNRWSSAAEVVYLPSTLEAREWVLRWMKEFALGRKRILDTALAATFHVHGIRRVATANPADFSCFEIFEFEPWARLP